MGYVIELLNVCLINVFVIYVATVIFNDDYVHCVMPLNLGSVMFKPSIVPLMTSHFFYYFNLMAFLGPSYSLKLLLFAMQLKQDSCDQAKLKCENI